MKTLLILAASLALAGPALASQAVTLRPDTFTTDRVVTLGDLFDNAGAAAQTPIAARTGASVVLNARAVQVAAARAGLDWANAEGLKTIVVHGSGPVAPAAPTGGSVMLAGGVVTPATRGEVDVLAYTRNLAAGEIVQPQDLVWAKAVAAPMGAPSDAETVIGLAAKRPLRAGAFVNARDVGAAQVVKPGETITVTFTSEGVTLALDGKAVTAAGVGEPVNVMNTASKKTIQAIVTAPGQAVVGPAADALKAAGPARYALR